MSSDDSDLKVAGQSALIIGTLIAVGAGAYALARKFKLLPVAKGLSGPRKIVALGDSLTADGRYVRYLGATGFGYVGRGVKDIASHLDEALALKPTDVIVFGGVNDLASGRSFSTITGELSKMYERIRAAGARPVAVLVAPWKGDVAKTAAVNQWIRESGVAHVETWRLGSAEGRLLPSYNAGDGVHLNGAGQKALGKMIKEQAFA